MRFRLFFLLIAITIFLSFNSVAYAETLVLPADLVEISEAAFYGDTSLDVVIVPDGTTDIGPRAFAYSSVKRIQIPDSVSTIGLSAFAGTNAVIYSSENSFAKEYADANNLLWMDANPTETVHMSLAHNTTDTPIRTPSNLKGLKIRVMDSQMAIDMMNAFGGSATVMGYGDIYIGMRQGVIDGAENTVSALRDHADVTRYYCYDEHTMAPDVIIISADIWSRLTPGQQEVMRRTAAEMAADYRERWANFENKVKETFGRGVTFVTDVDKEAFREAVRPIYEKLKVSEPQIYAFVERIQAAS